MVGEIRPEFEVIKKGQILHFIPGDRRFGFNERLIQGAAVPIVIWTSPTGPTKKE